MAQINVYNAQALNKIGDFLSLSPILCGGDREKLDLKKKFLALVILWCVNVMQEVMFICKIQGTDITTSILGQVKAV